MFLFENNNELGFSGIELNSFRRKRKVLNLLYQQYTLPASNIGKKIGISLPTAIATLKELSDTNLVEQRGIGESKGGRKPILFGLRNDTILVIACELGRFNGKVAIYNSHNQLVAPVATVQHLAS